MLSFEKLVPILSVKDLTSEVDFYLSLGFHISYQGDEFPDFIAVAYRNIEFGLSLQSTFSSDEANRSILWQFQVNDLTEAVKLFRQHGYHYTQPRKFWEQGDGWSMEVQSPNGYQISLEGQTPGQLDQDSSAP